MAPIGWTQISETNSKWSNRTRHYALFKKYIPGKDRESFVSELEVFGGLKSAIQVLSSLINSIHTVDFLHGLVNSLRNEILGLVLIAASIVCSTKLQFEYLELKANNEDDEFVSLRRAYKGEKNVSI